MPNQLAVSVRHDHTLIGLFENQKLVELFLDRPDQESCVGNIYVGKVVRILNNIQAAFVNIGLPKDGFLAGDDVEEQESDKQKHKRRHAPISERLKVGQLIPVQVEKDEIADKGKKLTMDISLPGRFFVYFPCQKKVNISKRVEDRKERKRLKDLLEETDGADEGGWIVRTVAEGASRKELLRDAKTLIKTWKEISAKVAKAKEPMVVHRELTPLEQVLRDHYNDNFDRILVDSLRVKQHIDRFVRGLSSSLLPRRVTKYVEPDELLETFHFRKELERAMSRKVWLDCGGYLIIEETETLTAIDVNTGKNVKGGANLDALLRTNLEAAHEIGRQLRLRGLGGIIVVDFIDMKSSKEYDQVIKALQDSLSKDKTAFDITTFSEIGLVQITRKRTGESLITALSEECHHCHGNGRILTLRN
ncbi:MAG: Rne/Rng family ribonuclease [Candidatus Omnitrophica bacterium]|nr:Ribonuclease G [bacterium]NUN98243.1 Rne/Rng family ribonuclease [Candidatus Omnitrophota bacterium]